MTTFWSGLNQLLLAQVQGAPVGQGGFMEVYGSVIMLGMMFGVIYFLLIRPANKQRQEHAELLNKLKKNDEVMTNGGIYGKITNIDARVVTLEIADKVRIKILRDQIRGRWNAEVSSGS